MKINLATAEGQQAWLDYHNAPQNGYRLPWNAGPADLWLAIVNDGKAPLPCRMTAAKELRLLGPKAIAEARSRAVALWEEEQEIG